MMSFSEPYKKFVKKNYHFLSSAEHFASLLTWLLPEKISNSELAPEAISSLVGLFSVLNEYIVEEDEEEGGDDGGDGVKKDKEKNETGTSSSKHSSRSEGKKELQSLKSFYQRNESESYKQIQERKNKVFWKNENVYLNEYSSASHLNRRNGINGFEKGKKEEEEKGRRQGEGNGKEAEGAGRKNGGETEGEGEGEGEGGGGGEGERKFFLPFRTWISIIKEIEVLFEYVGNCYFGEEKKYYIIFIIEAIKTYFRFLIFYESNFQMLLEKGLIKNKKIKNEKQNCTENTSTNFKNDPSSFQNYKTNQTSKSTNQKPSLVSHYQTKPPPFQNQIYSKKFNANQFRNKHSHSNWEEKNSSNNNNNSHFNNNNNNNCNYNHKHIENNVRKNNNLASGDSSKEEKLSLLEKGNIFLENDKTSISAKAFTDFSKTFRRKNEETLVWGRKKTFQRKTFFESKKILKSENISNGKEEESKETVFKPIIPPPKLGSKFFLCPKLDPLLKKFQKNQNILANDFEKHSLSPTPQPAEGLFFLGQQNKNENGSRKEKENEKILFFAEMLHILRPLLYSLSILLWGRKAWKPWAFSFLFDSLHLHLLHRLASASNADMAAPDCAKGGRMQNASIPGCILSEEEKTELRRRKVVLAFYLLRSPCFEAITKPSLSYLINLLKFFPLAASLSEKGLNLFSDFQSVYFYTSAS